MKKVYYTLALAALLTAGCSQNDELSVIEQPNVKENALTATFDGVTRTYTTDGRNTLWSAEDVIFVGASGTMDKYTLSSSGGATTGVFLPEGDGDLADDSYAVFGPCTNPSIASKTVSGFTIPSTISYTDPNCENVIMMGKVNKDQKTVSFKNTGAILYVKIGKDININKVKVVANYAISGAATVEWKEDNESHEEKPIYKITDTYSVGDHDNITVTGVSTAAEDNYVVIPLPSSEGAKTIKVFVGSGTDDATKQIFYGSVKIERNKYYKIEYNRENDLIVNMETGLIEALNTETAKKVTMVQDITINNNQTVTHAQGVELNMGGKTLTIAEGKKLDVTLGTTGESNSPIYTISKGTISAYNNAVINCYIKEACIIELKECQFKAANGSTLTMNLYIPAGDLNGLKGTDGTELDEYLRLSYSGTQINNEPTQYPTISFNKERTEPINITKTVGSCTITLNIVKQS